MKDFIFHNPTRIIFGRNALNQLGDTCRKLGNRFLLVWGRGSVHRNGIYQQVVRQLESAGLTWVDHGGVQANPVLPHAREGVTLARREQVDAILAVGGGSVIDESKAIAAGSVSDRDIWELVEAGRPIQQALPVVTVLTLAATASEMNGGAVLTNPDTGLKLSLHGPALYPRTSFLNPEFTFTVPADQTTYGAVDAISHLVESYFNHQANAALSMSLAESVIRTIRETLPTALAEPDNYEARATLMWSATVAFNGLIRSGYGVTSFPNHMIEHGISGIFPRVAHGAGLAIVMPAWMRSVREEKADLLARFFRQVSGADTVDQGMDGFEAWLREMGAPVRLRDVGIQPDDLPKIAEAAAGVARAWGMTDYPNFRILGILEQAL